MKDYQFVIPTKPQAVTPMQEFKVALRWLLISALMMSVFVAVLSVAERV